ncbi:MAG: DNA methyltransferase [Bacteroidia bacterium]
MTREQAKEKLTQLVERYREHKDEYHSVDYNEQKTRQDFINPLLECLGWDIDNKKEASEAYREVIYEDKVSVGGKAKAPDYGFRLAGSTTKRLFYVEAKKPSVALKVNKEAAYQLRRYGSSAQALVSILTNFEDFIVYDCSKVPKLNDSATVARLKHIHFEDYPKEFDFIYDTFSHEAVTKGRFDKFVQSAASKKGTDTLDKRFVQSLDEWRKYLAVNIALNNKKINDEELNYAVQLTLDRLIFLRFCEDRSVEPYGQLQKAASKGDAYKNLLDLFRQADDKYNSGLFDFEKDTITPGLKFNSGLIKDVIDELYYPICNYEFSVMPVEILGNAYEQFLGKVIRITPSRQVKIEEKPEVRKAGGVYYTPQYIVDYIVKNTVGKRIDGKAPKDIEKIKIVDPACGSGSFLLGAFEYLLNYHIEWYHNKGYATKKGKDNPFTPLGTLTTHEKKRILLNNIFGVDLDANAVEVSKLSLLLKCMEGETEASIKQQVSMFHERVLPDLDNNVKCGNSLIDTDIYDSEIDFGEEKKIKPFNWKKQFPQVFKQAGFDAVIGNPPYVRQELLDITQKEYFSQKYKVHHGAADLYTYFFEKGIGLLNEKGIFGIIVASKWMKASYGEPLRKWVKNQNIYEIIDFGGLPVFQGVTTYPCIFISGNNKIEKTIHVTNVKTLHFDSLEKYIVQNKIKLSQQSLDDIGWNLASDKEQKLLTKIKSSGVPLKLFVKGKIYRGILTGLNEAFVIDAEVKRALIKEDKGSAELIKPFLVGKDIKRYMPPQSDKFVIFTKRGTNINNYPAIKRHLFQFKKQLSPKPKDFKGQKWEGRKPGNYTWFEIQDTIDYYKEFEKPKILWPGISSAVTSFTIDYNKYYGNDNNQLIISDDKYLLGILNSSLSKFQLLNICDKVQGGFYRLKIVYIEKLVIKVMFTKSEFKIRDEIIKNVESLLRLNSELMEAKLQTIRSQIKQQIEYIEEKIDQLIYELYQLSPEEIKIVEGGESE